MTYNYANLPALLEGNNLEESFQKVYGRPSKEYIEEYEPTEEVIRSVLNDMQVYTTSLVITNGGITASDVYVNREALQLITELPTP